MDTVLIAVGKGLFRVGGFRGVVSRGGGVVGRCRGVVCRGRGVMVCWGRSVVGRHGCVVGRCGGMVSRGGVVGSVAMLAEAKVDQGGHREERSLGNKAGKEPM